jgi:hypothetical protein
MVPQAEITFLAAVSEEAGNDVILIKGGFKFRSEHPLCSGSRRDGCNGNDGS